MLDQLVSCLDNLTLTVSNYELEEEAGEYVNSINIEDNSVDEYGQENPHEEYNHDIPVDDYSIPEQQQYEEVQPEHLLENAYSEGRSVPVHTLNTVPVTPDVTAEEPAEEPMKKTYASIVWACTFSALDCSF